MAEQSWNLLLPDLLPNRRGRVGMNSVCIAQTIVDSRAKRDETELNGTATTEFQDRCLKPLGHPSSRRSAAAERVGLTSSRFGTEGSGQLPLRRNT
jgi:hypothetical protein